MFNCDELFQVFKDLKGRDPATENGLICWSNGHARALV